ncbi:unnamed protein product [Candidula unifasciata]|uniref:ADP-ribosyl cyclase/cyclic ADP-ribose hydrolase n=1 Tax=Candidula unifasciata TaxID=100452 RepID=A0A8S3YZP9_9EUPU|nr:unnamed protein product [Candidula unifasciata]
MLKSVLMLTSLFTIIVDHHAVRSQGGATQQIEAIVKGRCFAYRFVRPPGLLPIPDVDCDELWANFSSAWTYRESCGQNRSSYENLIHPLNQPLPPNKSLFWEETKDFTHRLANDGKRYVPIESTLIGYVADDLTWCGQTSAPGINFTYCPPYHSCSNEVMFDFWVAASKWFASHAQGEVRVVLNGSLPAGVAYGRNSVFASVELANLRSGIVTKLTALLVHDLDKPKMETCGSQSLLDLKADVLAKNIAFDCLENPPEVKYLLCADLPESPECKQNDCGNLPPYNRGSGVVTGSKEGLCSILLYLALTSVVISMGR